MPDGVHIINNETIPRCPIHNKPLKVDCIDFKRSEVQVSVSCKEKEGHLGDFVLVYRLSSIEDLT